MRWPAGLVSNEEIEEIARAAVRDIGYEQDGHWRDAEVQVRIRGQSAHIAQGVDQDGAGDQGIMFGYACRETAELMPARLHIRTAFSLIWPRRGVRVWPVLGPIAKARSRWLMKMAVR